MSGDGQQQVPTNSAPKKTSRKPKKKAVPKIPVTPTTSKLEFTKWLSLYTAGRAKIALEGEIARLPKDFQPLAYDLLMALDPEGQKPSGKFKTEKFSVQEILNLSSKIQNAFFMAFVACSTSTPRDLQLKLLNGFFSSNFNDEKLSYLLARVSNLRTLYEKNLVWNAILDQAAFKEIGWDATQLRLLEWGFSHGLTPENSNLVFSSWSKASEQFYDLESSVKNRIYRKLLEADFKVFWPFLIHVARDSVLETPLESIMGNKTHDALIGYFKNRHIYSGPWLNHFELKLISPMLKKHIDSIMFLTNLLPFLAYLETITRLLPLETLPRAINRCYNKKDDLAELFGDSRVSTLERKLIETTTELLETKEELGINKARIAESESRIREFENALSNLESQLRDRVSTDSAGSAATVQKGKVEFLKALLAEIDYILNSDDGFGLRRSLQKLGITKLGTPHESFMWDSETCESLTGDAMSQGIVVRSGYTWTEGSRKTLIVRVLLKSI